MAVTSADTRTIKMSKGERDHLDKLESMLARIDGRYLPWNVESSDLRDAQRRVRQMVRRYDKAKS